MKKLILVLCLILSSTCLAESSAADDFMANLSKTWDSFLDMASETGDAVSNWANDSGITEWVEGAAGNLSVWAKSSGLADWAQGALKDINTWVNDSGITEWAQGAAADLQAFIDENGPAVEAWLTQAGEEVRKAWNTLIKPEGHTKEEIKAAYEAVFDSLTEAQDASPASEEAPAR